MTSYGKELESNQEAESNIWDGYYKSRRAHWQSSGVSEISLRFCSKYSYGKKLLEIGCGAGKDAVGFIQLGFGYTGIDISPEAIIQAQFTLSKYNALLAASSFFEWESTELYDVVYDKGVFHNLAGPERRSEFANKVAARLNANGIWVTVCGTADNYDSKIPHGAIFLQHIIEPVERYFEVLEVVKAPYGIEKPFPDFMAWYCVFRRR
jgi:2-polyprenyl-3-methyl-5-hydroxy-6-metoxy-1,4-benzoquinol methylase